MKKIWLKKRQKEKSCMIVVPIVMNRLRELDGNRRVINCSLDWTVQVCNFFLLWQCISVWGFRLFKGNLLTLHQRGLKQHFILGFKHNPRYEHILVFFLNIVRELIVVIVIVLWVYHWSWWCYGLTVLLIVAWRKGFEVEWLFG